jgi:hypothetical protein
MGSRKRFFLPVGVILLLPTLLYAQERPVELGIDGALAISFDRGASTSFQLPTQSFRVGFFLSDAVSLEPVVSVNYLKFAEASADYALRLELGGLYHFKIDRTGPQPYFRPAAGLRLIAARGDAVAQFRAGGGVGVKLPVASHLQHTFLNGLSGSNSIFAGVGLSLRDSRTAPQADGPEGAAADATTNPRVSRRSGFLYLVAGDTREGYSSRNTVIGSVRAACIAGAKAATAAIAIIATVTVT